MQIYKYPVQQEMNRFDASPFGCVYKLRDYVFALVCIQGLSKRDEVTLNFTNNTSVRISFNISRRDETTIKVQDLCQN